MAADNPPYSHPHKSTASLCCSHTQYFASSIPSGGIFIRRGIDGTGFIRWRYSEDVGFFLRGTHQESRMTISISMMPAAGFIRRCRTERWLSAYPHADRCHRDGQS